MQNCFELCLTYTYIQSFVMNNKRSYEKCKKLKLDGKKGIKEDAEWPGAQG